MQVSQACLITFLSVLYRVALGMDGAEDKQQITKPIRT